ncbi:sugar ABC transporter ATP-binding protein [Aureimonas sp. Leaf454]|nr:sugar ABC transporter ATP-binding protein [Aureimonas sp. Leaf454]
MAGDVLTVRGLTKTFPGVKALDGVDFTLRAGEVHALLGENGAGKSTLIKTVTGVLQRDGGEVLLGSNEIHPKSPAEALKLGIGTVYQEVNLLPNLSVAENLFMGRQPGRLGFIRNGPMNRRAREIMKGYGVDIDVRKSLSDFSVAVQQLVAIARAVDFSASVLILDEPTASLDASEVLHLFEIVRSLKARGIGILFVTHFLDQVYALADRITILRNGRLIGTSPASELPRLKLVSLMLGRDLAGATHERREATAPKPDAFLSFRGYGRRGQIHPFDLDIGRGEVVGVAGLLGSGRSETAKLIFGIDRADGGEALLDGKRVRIASPRDAVALKFGFLPEERKTEGIVGDLSVRENIILALQARRGWLKPLARAEQERIAAQFIRSLDIRTRDAETPIRLLSGGNQQKALIARWLATEPEFLILDEPTRGIDIGAHAEIVRLIEDLCRQGMALLVISSELEEITAYSHRIRVLRDRSHVGDLTGEAIGVETIIHTIAAEAKP